MQDLVKSPLVREQKTFEQRLAAAVILHSVSDFMMFEEASEPKTKQARHERKVAKAAGESAERFLSPEVQNGSRGSRGFQFWLDVLCQGKSLGVKRAWYQHIERQKSERYDAIALERSGSLLPDYPRWVVAEACRRVIDARWLIFYTQQCEDSQVRNPKNADFWKGLYRTQLNVTDIEQEAKDIMFEHKHGLAA